MELAEEERVRLRSLLRGGKASVRMVTRARVLLKADEGYTDGAIAAAGGGHCYGTKRLLNWSQGRFQQVGGCATPEPRFLKRGKGAFQRAPEDTWYDPQRPGLF